MSPNCTNCGSVVSQTQLSCLYCGFVLRYPATVEDEMLLVREQSSTATRIATAKENVLDASNGRSENLAQFWASAYIPNTVSALLSALTLCLSGMPNVTCMEASKMRPLVVSLATRAKALESVVATHPEATPADKMRAAKIATELNDNIAKTDNAIKLFWKILIGFFVVMFGLPALIGLFNVTFGHSDSTRPQRDAEYYCQQESKLASCLQACAGKAQWACDMAEVLKNGGPAKTTPTISVQQIKSIINNDVAKKIRQITHPTGSDGSLSSVSTREVNNEIIATIIIAWKGTFSGGNFTTTVEWKVGKSGHVASTIINDTAIVEASDNSKQKLDDYLKSLIK